MNTEIDLLSVLDVRDVDARTHHDIFVGESLPTPHGRAFGGQVLGQAIMAAGATVTPSRDIHSMHCYFLRAGRSDGAMTFEVARLNDGGSFSARRVQVYQDGEVIMSMFASFQERQDGLEHQEHIDVAALPQPEELMSQSDRYGDLPQDGRASWVLSRPFDLRYTTSDILLAVDDQSAQQKVWIRAKSQLDDRPLLHRAALAFGSDYTLVETILRTHGIPWATPGIRAASLDHAMWFHRPFRADEWLLYAHESSSSQGGRGLVHGKFFNRSGELVASVSQEAMVRATRPPTA